MNGPPRYIASANLPSYNWQLPWQNQRDNYLGLPFLARSGSQASSSCLDGPRFQPPCRQASAEVQKYLDINANESIRNHNRVRIANHGLDSFVDVNAPSQADKDISQFQSELYCHTCKICFQDSGGLNAHLKSHKKCDFPNCSFISSRKTLKLHEIQCHQTGKLQIILDTPEQIAKWREERKRNYPTLSNVVKKQEEEKQKRESGQTLQNKQFRYNRRQGWKQGKRGSYTRGRRKFKQSYAESRESQHNEFNPMPSQILQDENVTTIKENVLGVNNDKTKQLENDTKEAVMNCGALGALAAVYGVSSSDEDDQCDKNKEQSQTEHIEKESEPCPKQESKKAKLNESNVDNIKKIVKKKNYRNRSRVKKKREQSVLQNNKRPSLLEMLLAPDIRHERNVILQCLRYIVKKDFFGIGSQDNGNVS